MPKIEKFAVSKNKDHTIMTGGTLTIDKVVTSETNLKPFVYFFTISEDQNEINSDDFHKGIHSIEHSFAFEMDSGSIRAHYNKVTGEDSDFIVDISPYIKDENSLGFRITSFIELDIPKLEEAIKNGLESMKIYFENDNAVPFSTPEECGQYNFHSGKLALGIINDINTIKVLEISAPQDSTEINWIVGDLRLLKPRPENDFDHYVFPPLVSHKLSDIIEKNFNTNYDNYLQLGTFGCMTGSYLISDIKPEEKDEVHKNILEILVNQSFENIDLEVAAEKVIENIKKYSEI